MKHLLIILLTTLSLIMFLTGAHPFFLFGIAAGIALTPRINIKK